MLTPRLPEIAGTDTLTMVIVDMPLCVATTGSLAAFYMHAEAAQGRKRMGAIVRLPMLIALGTGLAPHLSKAVFDGLRHMAGEFVRTPKDGVNKGRYRARTDLPFLETALCLMSFAASVASIQTGHYFATPFAILFTIGYGYVSMLVAHEQSARRQAVAPVLAASSDRASDPATPAEAPVGKLAA